MHDTCRTKNSATFQRGLGGENIPRVVELDETVEICISPDGYVVICIYVIYLVCFMLKHD